MDALIPTQITGPKTLCYNSSATYTMPNLLAGESVTWTASGTLQILSSTSQSVTVKAISSSITGSVTATYAVIRNADDSTTHTLTSTYEIWLGGPSVSVTNNTTNHTSSGYTLNMNTSGTNQLHFNNNSEVTSVNWSFPGTWSYNGTSGFDIDVYSWSGNNPFTVTATNSCDSYSAFFYPMGGSFRVKHGSTVYPNIAGEYVNVSLDNKDNWKTVKSVRIVSSGTGRVYYSKEITDSFSAMESNSMNIALDKLPKGPYVLEIRYNNFKESHNLFIE